MSKRRQEQVDLTGSPDDFDSHCKWLLDKMQEWEDAQKRRDKNSRRRMNYFFRKEIDKNTKLVVALAEKCESMTVAY